MRRRMMKTGSEWVCAVMTAILLGLMGTAAGADQTAASAGPAAAVTDIVLDVNAVPFAGEALYPDETTGADVYPLADAPTAAFSMMGVAYGQGVCQNKYYDSDVSEAVFTVDAFNTVQFVAGHCDFADRGGQTLEIYMDDKLYGTVELAGTMMNHLVTVDVSGHSKLRLTWRGRYAIGNVMGTADLAGNLQAAGNGAVSPTDPAVMRLVDARNLDVNAVPASGQTVMPFEWAGARIYPLEDAPLERIYMMGNEYAQGVANDKYYTSDVTDVSYNIGGTSRTMQFVLGHQDAQDFDDSTFEIYLNDKFYGDIPLQGSMMSQLVTVDVTGITKVRLSWKGRYGIGNVCFSSESAENVLALNRSGAQAAALPGADAVQSVDGSLQPSPEMVMLTPYEWVGTGVYPVDEEPAKQFSMMGVGFGQGLQADKYYESDVSQGSYNLGGGFETLQFTPGHLDGAEGGASTLEIYMDEKLYAQLPLEGTMMNQIVTMNVSGVTKVRFWWKGRYGLGNICAVPASGQTAGDDQAMDRDELYEYLMQTQGRPIGDNDQGTDTPQPGTQAETVQPETPAAETEAPPAQQDAVNVSPYVTTGIRTYPVQEEPMARFSMMGVEFAQGLAADKYYDSDVSEASYNIGKQFTQMTFTAGHLDGGAEGDNTLEIYLDEQLFLSVPLTGTMMNQDVTLDVTGITKVRFWWKGRYGIGNIVCS